MQERSAPKSGRQRFARIAGILAVIFIASVFISALPSFSANAESQSSYLASFFGWTKTEQPSVQPQNESAAVNPSLAVIRTVCASGCDLPTIAAAVAEVNAGVPATGVTYNIAGGHTETAPAGGYTITATGTATDQIIFQRDPGTMGANPVITASNAHTAGSLHDAVFEILGGDYITLSGLTMLENPANTVTTAASNTMTEWGVALLYATTTNGAQNNSILNCTIDLDRTYQNTFGIYSNSTHSATTITTTASATTPAGANSGLKVYNSVITDVNNGIVVVGPTAAADQNDGLDIGGASAATTNSITNFGTTGTFSGYANVSGTVNGILVRNTKNFNVSFNTITSSNGGTTAGTLNGIQLPAFSAAPTGTITNNINNNNISVRSGVVAGAINGINVLGTSGNATTTLNVNNNDFNNITHTVAAASGAITLIGNVSPSTQNINNNTFTNLNVTTTGSVTFISASLSLPANTQQNVNGNSIVTAFNKTGAGGTVTLFTNNGSSPATVTETNNNNNFSNITVTGATTIAGWSSTDGGTPVKTVTGNTFSNWTGGTNSVTGLTVGFSGSATVSNNTVNNITGAGAITGITSSSGNQNFSQNTVHTLSGTGTGAVTGMSITGGTTQNFSRNKIYNLQNSNAAGLVNGFLVSTAPTTGNIFNNLIGDLRATTATSATTPVAGDSVRGISITATSATTTLNVSFNTVYLNATSSGANFSSSALFATSSATATNATLNLRNNILVNLSTPTGTGAAIAYRRSSTDLTNYGAASNNNDFFAGTPSANRLIFYDGTNADQTLAAYKGRVAPRDSASVTENPNFLSTNGADATFLHINPATPTQLESGGTPVTGITDDYDGETRNATTPDIGADEFTGTPVDLNPPTITYTPLVQTTSTANRTITATITDVSGVAGGANSPRIYFRKNGGMYFSTQCVLVSGNNYDCTIDYSLVGGVAAGDLIEYFIVAQDTNGNVGSNPSAGFSATSVNSVTTPPSNPNSYTIAAGTSGTLEVGVGNTCGVSGTDPCPYQSLTNPGGIFAALNAGVLTGNLTIDIRSDLTAETGAVALNQLIEEGATPGTYTVTIKPSGGAARLISGTNNTVLLDFNGADRVTINGLNSGGNSLTIRNTGTGAAVRFINDASNNSVTSTTLEAGSNSAVLSISSGATTGNDNISIVGNTIRDRTDAAGVPFNSINLVGTSAAVSNSNILINNNQIINFTQAGIVVQFSDNVTFTGNDISQTAARTTALTGVAVNSAAGTNLFSQNTIHDLNTSLGTTGMTFNDARATTVSRNRIYNFPSTSGSTSTLAGINFNGSSGNPASLTVVNNMVSIIPGFTNAQLILGIRDFGFGGNTFNSFFNSVLVGGTGSGSSNTYACQRGSAAPTDHTMMNTICFNNRTGGTGNHFAAGDSSDGTGTFTSNYNIFVGTGATAANFFDRNSTGTAVPVNFAAWQAGGRDANSQASNPSGNYTVANMFASPTDLHLNTTGTNPALDAGTPAGGVTNDFDGQTRPSGAAPEIGADEIVVAVAPTVQFSAATYTGAEGTTATVTVTRTGDTTGASTVNYATSDGTATGGATCGAGVDYENASGTLSFAAGETSKTFNVTLCSDAVLKGDETINLTLSAPTGATLGTQSTAVLTITNVAPPMPGVLALSSATYSVGEAGTTVTITVNRTGGSDGAVSVNYSLTDGTATGGAACGGAVDYVNTGGTVNFANGETSKTFTVGICNDAALEGNETFNVTLSGATGGATIGSPSTAVVTIIDDETAQPGTLALSSATYTVGEAGGTLTITVNRTGGTDGEVSVNYSLTDGTATGGAACGGSVDYVNTGGTVTFAGGETSKTFNVGICNDSAIEGDETFTVTLSGATGGATIGSPASAVVTITDDDMANPGVLALSSATYTVGEAAGTVTVTVNRTGGTDGAVAVNYTLADGTATGGAACGGAVDYVNTGGTVNFAAGQSSQTFTVAICNDATVEPNETFTVTLSGATGGATIGTPSSATVTITDDDTPPPTGNVIVNPGNVAYMTLKEAFDAINAGTHTGAITIDIAGNTTETASAILNASGTGGASYTSVVIAPTGGARVIEGSIVGAVIKLNGADNVTIDGRIGGAGRNLTVRNNNPSTATAAIWLASVAAGNGASNNVVRNLEIAAGQTSNLGANTTIGILMAGATVSVTADGNDNDNNSFIANRITRARYGIVSRGVAANNNLGLVITDNIVGPNSFGADEIGKVGIYLQADTGALVSGNTVQYVGGDLANAIAGADRCGICIGNENWGQAEATVITSGDYTVTKNKVHDVVEERTFSAVGIRLGTTRAGAATNNLVANNFIYNIRANGTLGDQPAGIGYVAGHTDRIVFNSISMTGDMDPAGALAATIYGNAMRVSTVNGANNANLTMMNNSIYLDVNSNTAANHYYTIALPAATYTFGTGGLNYNNYYFNPANPQLRTGAVGVTSGNTPGAEFLTLANWQAALTPPQDANSKQADPMYFSPTNDLHIFSTSPNIDMGTPITGITDDIDSQVRPNGAAPDIGADEFYPAPGTLQFSSANYSATEQSGTVTITVTRAGGATGAVSVDYATSNGTATGGAACGAGVDYVNTSGTLTWADNDVAPKTFTVTLCNDGIFKGSETFNVTLSNPSGGATLGTPSTATVTILDSSIFTGTITVGTGGTFTSLTNPGGLFEAINNGGVSGNLTVNIISDLTAETGAIALNQFAGGFTMLIQPSGGARLISGGSATDLLNFNGADNVTINGLNSGGNSLTIRNTGSGSGTAVRFTNDASNNSVQNTTLEGGGTSSVLFIATGATTGNDNISITGNIIRDRTDATSVPFNVINLAGTSAAISNSNILITNNQLINFVQAGLFVANSDNVTFTNNEVFQTASRTTALFGVVVNSMLGTNVFSQNTIHDLTTTVATTGMQFSDVRATTVSRNRIYNFPSTSGSTGVLTGIQFNGVTGAPASLTVVNNMVSIIPNFTNNQLIRGIFDFGFATNVFTSHFNSVLVGGTSTGAADTWACIRGTFAPTTYTMSNNICFNNRTGGTGDHFAAGDQSNGTGTFTSNYNIFVGTGTANAANFFDKGTVATGTPVNFATWQAGPPPRDANSQASNPVGNYTVANMFVSPIDLHLANPGTNPAFNAGTAVEGITIDFDGQTRDSAPDIGADEIVVAAGIISLSSSTYTVGESDGTVTITVNRAGTTGAVSVNYTLTDGTATGGAACGGAVDYVNTGGTINFADGQSSQTFTVAVCPDTLDEANETFTVTLSGATGGAVIGSPSTATVTITDDDATPSLSINDVSQAEGNSGTTAFTFTVTLSAASGQTVTVDYATVDGTATAPSDYAAIPPTTLTFAPGETTKQVTVNVVGDTAVEANETFFVNLANAVNATISDNQGQGTIVNDDVQPGQISISDVRVVEGNSGTRAATFTVTLVSGGSPNPTTVNYTTANGTATAGSDYVATSGTLTFAPGETVKTVTVTINGDTLIEATETFFVNLSNPSSNAVIADGQGVGFIIDDDRAYVADFDEDRKADFSVWRPSDGYWYTLLSTNNVATYKQFGTNGDKPVPGDYDGDGIVDIAVFRPSEGIWYIQRSSDFGFISQQWGLATDKLVQGDYDGDGKTDIAVFRDGLWFVIQSSNGNQLSVQFGAAGDIPVQGDYDGDAKTDFAVYRGGNWYVLQSSNGAFVAQQFGLASDKPLVGDFDGDGSADFTVYRDGTWYILGSLNDSFQAVSFGTATDIPVPADYDGDGISDVAVFRPSNGYWYVLRSSDGAFVAQQWGQNNDVPIPAAYQSR